MVAPIKPDSEVASLFGQSVLHPERKQKMPFLYSTISVQQTRSEAFRRNFGKALAKEAACTFRLRNVEGTKRIHEQLIKEMSHDSSSDGISVNSQDHQPLLNVHQALAEG